MLPIETSTSDPHSNEEMIVSSSEIRRVHDHQRIDLKIGYHELHRKCAMVGMLLIDHRLQLAAQSYQEFYRIIKLDEMMHIHIIVEGN